MIPAPLDQRVQAALSEVPFPAPRWRLVAEAEHNGADGITLAELRALPPGEYRSLARVVYAVAHGVGGATR